MFVRGRQRAWELARVTAEEEVLLVGLGTGVDLQYLPDETSITGIDLSVAMLNVARKKAERLHRTVKLLQADASQIPLPDDRFDVVALFLILSVVPDPAACFREAVRLSKPGGRIIVFDKFVPAGKRPSWKRRLANLITRPFGTDINRRFEEIIQGAEITIVSDEPIFPGSAFRTILISS